MSCASDVLANIVCLPVCGAYHFTNEIRTICSELLFHFCACFLFIFTFFFFIFLAVIKMKNKRCVFIFVQDLQRQFESKAHRLELAMRKQMERLQLDGLKPAGLFSF
jgi:Ni,Fe-hydrogenase I cytochrome b subunit